jgi:hypothetical protein
LAWAQRLPKRFLASVAVTRMVVSQDVWPF